MTQFNHDLTTAPRDKSPILAVHKSGNVVQSYWIPPRHTGSGKLLEGNRWSGFNLGDEPIAWAPWPTYDAAPVDPVPALDSINHQFMAALDGVGSGA